MVEVDVRDHSVEWISQGRGEQKHAALFSECGFPTQQAGVVNVRKPWGTVMETHTLPLTRLDFCMHERIETVAFRVLFASAEQKGPLGISLIPSCSYGPVGRIRPRDAQTLSTSTDGLSHQRTC